MSKEEMVEIVIRVPKSLLQILEAEDYLGWEKQNFFESAIKGLISSSVNNMDFDDCKAFEQKYGEDVTTIYLPERYKDS